MNPFHSLPGRANYLNSLAGDYPDHFSFRLARIPGKLVSVLTTLTSQEFEKAVTKLKEALAQPQNEFIRDSVIQRFEFSIELAWKTSKKIMGTSATAPKDVIREMAQAGYIENVDLWLQAIDMRNLTSHTYKEDLAEKVFLFVVQFFAELQNLVQILRTK